jgi:two-component system, chemotaxis family, protein-glutamate methylesterase/glutaminase
MPRTRVLVVDDAVVVRRIVTDALGADTSLEVVGTAPNGRIALAKIPQLNPDIVTLDVEMPEMDGLETLVELRKLYPRLPVVMFSTLTERGAKVTMEALLKGANDYVTKPANVGSVTEAMERIRDELVPKIHALCGAATPVGVDGRRPSRVRSASPGPHPRSAPTARVEVVTIGVSTGGPNALSDLLPRLPGDLPAPIAVVQHMPPMFTRLLAERLDARCALSVCEAVEGQVLAPGHVYLAPGDHHLEVRRRGGAVVTGLTRAPHENSCRPSADVLFRSAAATYGPGVLALVLTGMGHDGRRGVEEIREAGGFTLVQDQASSVVWGMPGSVVAAGLADEVLALDRLGSRLVELVGASAHRRVVPS